MRGLHDFVEPDLELEPTRPVYAGQESTAIPTDCTTRGALSLQVVFRMGIAVLAQNQRFPVRERGVAAVAQSAGSFLALTRRLAVRRARRDGGGRRPCS